jgi:metal-responsive CopG/Arc/MetJ family transcriptional regulator
MKKRVYFVDIHSLLPIDLVEKIERYCERYHKANRSEGIRELIEVGLLISERRSEIEEKRKHPELLEEIHNQLIEGGLVDFVQRMNAKDFNIISSIFETEKKARNI